MKIIGTKWVFRNKLDENIIVSRNKARLVAQGYNQQEGIDYDEIYASVARLESIRILLAYACALDFKLFQTDVKSAFLNGFINEEVYTVQPPGFINFEKPNHVYKLKKALYGLKQAPKACSTCKDMCDNFAKIMHDEFEMSMMGELNFFLRLQIKQMEDGIFFNQSKYIKEMLKKFSLQESKPMKTSMSSDTKLIKDEECELIDSTKYRGMIEFAKILDIPCEGVYVFTNKWSLDEFAYGVPTDGPYQTNPPPDDIISSLRIDKEGQVRHIRYKEEIDVLEYQVLTREIKPTLKPLEEIIRENVFCLGVIGIIFPCVFVTWIIMSYTLKSSTLPIIWQNEWSGSLDKSD
uniref:Retrovirus-related Pol polyprotein from transposon TNT 1-94 n=1 Tax=Tanacetum cinerariifolium TaxID=118510 RepID=A0A699H0W1_TANCI|nr:retrovirus-related Pol polyprotein from transposon TNT 1-94 [Tanacetum cinerariifolium]